MLVWKVRVSLERSFKVGSCWERMDGGGPLEERSISLVSQSRKTLLPRFCLYHALMVSC